MAYDALGLIMVGVGMIAIGSFAAEGLARGILWVHGRTSKIVLRKQS